MLPLKNRLPLRTNRRSVEATAVASRSTYFTFLVSKIKNSDQPSRFAVILSKKISNLAVKRNLIRRQILSSIQDNLKQIKPGFDAIILPKKAIIEADYHQIKADVESLLQKSGLV